MLDIKSVWPWPKASPREPEEHHYRRSRFPHPSFGFTPTLGQGGIGGQASIDQLTAVLFQYPHQMGHDPDSCTVPPPPYPAFQVQPSSWYLVDRLFAPNHSMRGIRDLFYETNPFVDNMNPTPQEVEVWNVKVINLMRALVGITTPVFSDFSLYLQAQWSLERELSTYWEDTYHIIYSDGEPAATFIPLPVHQEDYFNGENLAVVPQDALSFDMMVETNSSVISTETPWALKLSNLIEFLCYDLPLNTSHPLFTATRIGMAWHLKPEEDRVYLRIKLSG